MIDTQNQYTFMIILIVCPLILRPLLKRRVQA